jgi:GntR family transcriptional regulator
MSVKALPYARDELYPPNSSCQPWRSLVLNAPMLLAFARDHRHGSVEPSDNSRRDGQACYSRVGGAAHRRNRSRMRSGKMATRADMTQRARTRAEKRRQGGDRAFAGLHIDSQDGTPLYLQLRRGLVHAIKDGMFKPDDALPSERVLAEALGVSRVTARKAIEALSRDGLIVRRRGSGNYIAPLLEQPLSRLTSFTEELQQRGFKPTSRWLRRTVTAALPDETLTLGLSPNSKVAKLERVRLADDVPMAYELSVLPATLLPRPERIGGSLYAYLADKGLMPVRALQHFRAINATARHAELLCLPEGAALMWVTRVSYLEDGRTIEFTQTFCRSDYYDFIAELRR